MDKKQKPKPKATLSSKSSDIRKTKKVLLQEIEELRARLAESENVIKMAVNDAVQDGDGQGNVSGEAAKSVAGAKAGLSEGGSSLQDVAERNTAAEKLEDLSCFSGENPNPVLRVSADQKLVYFNTASKYLFPDWHCEVGRTIPLQVQKHISRVLCNGVPEEVEVAVGAKTFLLALAPILRAGYVNIYARDTTELKQTLKITQKNEQQLRRAMQLNRSFTFEWYVKTGEIIRAEECADILGLTGEAAIYDSGDGFFQKLPAKDKTLFKNTIKALTPENNTYRITYRFLRPDGGVVVLEEIGLGVFDENNILQYLTGTTADITEGKRAEERLRRHQQDLSRAQEIGQLGSWRMDVTKNILDWSDENYRIFGVPQDTQLTYESFLETIHPADRHYVDGKWQAALTGEPYDIEHRIVVNGNTKWVREKAYLEMDDTGNLVDAFGITQDITDRKVTENTLKFLLTFDAKGVREDFFKALTRYLSRTLDMSFACIERLAERNMVNKIAVFSENRFLDNITYGLENTPCADVLQNSVCCFPSKVRYLFPQDEVLQEMEAESYVGVILRSTRGDPIGFIAVIGRKPLINKELTINILQLVAVRAAGELERRSAERALAESEERLRLALQAGRMATWDYQISERKMIWNNAFYEMLGYEDGAVVPSYSALLNRVHPDDLYETQTALQATVDDRAEYRTEFRVALPDGAIRWLWMLGQNEYNDRGKAVRSYGVLLDVTESKENALQIQKLNHLLQEQVAKVNDANRELESFSHSVSHDLRTPLRFVNAIVQSLIDKYKEEEPEDLIQKLDMILQTSNEMGNLIQRLLTFSRANRAALKKSRVDIKQLFQSTYEKLQHNHTSNAPKFTLNDLPPCEGDKTLLSEVVLNLTGNAIKFTRNVNKPKITVGYREEKGKVVYFIKDNGVGFDMEKASSLFVPFNRLHNPNDYEGTGIGLALAKRILTRHGGRIWAEAELNKGATFYFSLQ